MNRDLLQSYIREYERRFEEIHRKEIYKWRAVKQFQDTWDPDAEDFAEMLSAALSKTYNLMAAGNYWPRASIINHANMQPQVIRAAFLDLFNEDNDPIERIKIFQELIGEMHVHAFPGENAFQDDRAVLVYLNLRYPNNYFLYKYKMFKSFCEKIGHDYVPRRGASSNILQFLNLCTTVREELMEHNNLIKLHKRRLGKEEYFDVSFNILTQDFIYAVTCYLELESKPTQTAQPGLVLKDIELDPVRKDHSLKGRYVDYISQHRRNKRIGDLGEELVLHYEKVRCNPDFADAVTHSSKSEGDGLGFDILSFDHEGNLKYIEVKTTKGPADQAFYISGAELERSKREGNNYYLYRLFNFDEKAMTADFTMLQGDLSKYCINPTEYAVIVRSTKQGRLSRSQ